MNHFSTQLWQIARFLPSLLASLFSIFCAICIFPSSMAAELPQIKNNQKMLTLSAASRSSATDSVKKLDALPSGGSIAVFYPERFSAFFIEIINGIEEQTKRKVVKFPIESDGFDAAQLNDAIKRSDIKVVIALGGLGMKAAAAIEQEVPVIVGGFINMAEIDQKSLTGISLNPDPALIFNRLKKLIPETNRVIVVYDPQYNKSLIKMARQAAKAQGITIQANEAHNIAEASRIYDMIFKNGALQNAALWLPNDPTTVEEKTILPRVLEGSWNHAIPFFSSSWHHVSKGALFGFRPKNLELGRHLGNSALNILSGETQKKGISPLREVYVGLNARAASHLGIQINEQQQGTFDSVYPEL
jgi:putative ABC transport system substrate-binding protein